MFFRFSDKDTVSSRRESIFRSNLIFLLEDFFLVSRSNIQFPFADILLFLGQRYNFLLQTSLRFSVKDTISFCRHPFVSRSKIPFPFADILLFLGQTYHFLKKTSIRFSDKDTICFIRSISRSKILFPFADVLLFLGQTYHFLKKTSIRFSDKDTIGFIRSISRSKILYSFCIRPFVSRSKIPFPFADVLSFLGQRYHFLLEFDLFGQTYHSLKKTSFCFSDKDTIYFIRSIFRSNLPFP
jgi:hypothetical protein